MILTGSVTFISSSSRESNGKTYYNANLESKDDGKIYNCNTKPEVIAKMLKYKQYLAYFETRTWDGKLYLNLVDVEEIAQK